MRALGMMLLVAGLAACAAPGSGGGRGDAGAMPGSSMPFAGTWESCEGASTPAECSRYMLVQRGRRVCGTWSYVASGIGYEGRLIASATSETLARRSHVCGRPGSETRTECEDGWEAVDTPLRLCNGKLGDLGSADGICSADHRPVPASESGHEALLSESWVQECLSRDP